MMELILIACCKTKRKGGVKEYSTSPLADFLSEESLQTLLNSRKVIANRLGLPEGPDLGSELQDPLLEYLPAYQRYNGIIYRENDLNSVIPKMSTKRVIIISALYGVLDAKELIRDYELKMDSNLPGHVRVMTWWKHHGLGEIVSEIVCHKEFDQVHELLPLPYRSALDPWPPACRERNIIQYDYPGQGSGSIWRRAEELEKILRN